MERILILDLGLFEDRRGDRERWSEELVKKLLWILVFANRIYIRTMNPPPLYEAGVRYIKEPPDKEIFQSIGSVIKTGGADCEDLAAWRVSELREWARLGRKDGDARARFLIKKMRRPNGLLYHIMVLRGNGKVEDPSRRLGMGWEKQFARMRRRRRTI